MKKASLMSSFLLIGLVSEDADDSAPNSPADKAAEAFSATLSNIQKQFADQGDHLGLCKLALDGSTEVPVTAQLAHAAYDCILLGAGFREPEHVALFERVINSVHRHAPGAAIGLVDLPQDAPEAARRVLSQDYAGAGLLSPSASPT